MESLTPSVRSWPRLCENSEQKNNMLTRVLCFIFCNTLLTNNRTLMRVFGRSLSPKIVFPQPGPIVAVGQDLFLCQG